MRFNSSSFSEGEESSDKLTLEYYDIMISSKLWHHVSFTQLEKYVAEMGNLKESKTRMLKFPFSKSLMFHHKKSIIFRIFPVPGCDEIR